VAPTTPSPFVSFAHRMRDVSSRPSPGLGEEAGRRIDRRPAVAVGPDLEEVMPWKA
jgi:hypothetical protein